MFSTLYETPRERTRGKSKCGAPTIRLKRRCNDSSRLRSCRPKSSKNCFGSPKPWTRYACLRSSNTYRKPSGGTLSHLPQNRLHLLLRYSFPCSSVQKKRFLSMGFLIHLRPCSKESARKSIKRRDGLMIGARARTLSRENGNRLRPGCSLIQNSQASRFFTGWNRSPRNVIDQPNYEPCKGASAGCVLVCWSRLKTSGAQKSSTGRLQPQNCGPRSS